MSTNAWYRPAISLGSTPGCTQLNRAIDITMSSEPALHPGAVADAALIRGAG
jgi:hypothetical protein